MKLRYCLCRLHGQTVLSKALRIMRITTVIMLIGSIHVCATGISQTVSLSVKNQPLKNVFKEISKQTGISILCDEKLLEQSQPVTVNLKSATLEQALQACFSNQPLHFEIVNNTIIVSGPPVRELRSVDSLSSPPLIDVRGHVTDSLGNPLAGATVTVKGSKSASTITDANGDFYLRGVNGNAALIISNVGFETQEFKLKGKSDISLRLRVHSTSLLDVVVNKGYYNTTQRLNTGDVSTVSGVDIQKQPVTDPILALEGRVPGLYIQQTSGVPGAYSTIQIRGQNSLQNGNAPLYIVDGVPFSSSSLTNSFIGGGVVGNPGGGPNQGLSPINNLNPADIESIEVLKDADATAIYGSRGANGVILITSKKGKTGDTKFDMNVYTGSEKVTRTMPMLNTQQYLEMRHEAFNNDGTSPKSYDNDVNGFWDTSRYTNWQKVLIDNAAPFTNAQVSVSGGNANTQFLVSGGYSNQSTVFLGDFSDQKASLHFNLTNASLDQRFHMQLTASYVNDNSNLPQLDLTGLITLAPDAPALYDANGNLNWEVKDGAATWQNPLSYTLITAKAVTDNLIGNLVLSYEIVPGLQVKSNFGYNHAQLNQTNLIPATYVGPPDVNDPFNRSNSFGTTDTKTWIIEPQINYHRKLGLGQFDLLIGTTFQQNLSNESGTYAYGFASDALISNPLAATNYIPRGYLNTQYRYNALFGRFNYNWKEKYLLNITARRDGSSRFGPGQQFGNFGAIGVGWIFTKEQFLANSLPFLSFGKIRASYGTTGNDQIGDYQYLSTYYANPTTYQGVTMLTPTSLTNPNFAWETNKKFELGLELGFIMDRIFISASYYRNRSGNQLITYSLPQITGFNGVEANFPATVQNSGTEFSLNTTNIKTKNFSWTSSVNLSIPENKLVSFPGIENTSYFYSLKVGQSIFSHQKAQSIGVNPQAGVYSFASKDGSGIPSYPQDFVFTQPVTQKFYGGIDNNFSYKGFQLDVFIMFVKKLGYNYQQGIPYQPGITNENQPTYVLNHWQKAGDQSNVQQFSENYNAAYNAYNYLLNSDAIITDASFLRLQNLALSYRFHSIWGKKAHIQNMRIYIQCQNLLTITSYKGIDPETGSTGLPPVRVITVGLQVTL
jgi:TonB-dependent starch-binding outer membrane protein SusC